MYYALAGIFGILMFAFLGLWQAKCKELERLQQKNEELLKNEQERIDNLKSTHEYEITERDLRILRVLTKKNRQYCIKLLQQLKSNGRYYDFINADTIKQMQDILKEAIE
ncbi:MAG: hypothetical protein NC548_27335 [Lachnospiraceae bacterium]|nr:hypothetical protein [Lachnospiraceae bacterium]